MQDGENTKNENEAGAIMLGFPEHIEFMREWKSALDILSIFNLCFSFLCIGPSYQSSHFLFVTFSHQFLRRMTPLPVS